MPAQPATNSGEAPQATRPPANGTGAAAALPKQVATSLTDAPAFDEMSVNPAPRTTSGSRQSPANLPARSDLPPTGSPTTEAGNTSQHEDEARNTRQHADEAGNTRQPTDEALMAALCDGNDGALATLMHRWEVPVKSFLLRLGVPAADVEDTAQEAFVRLYLKRSAYHRGSAFKPWLLTLAANLGRNRMRWRLRRKESSIDALPEQSDTAHAQTGSPQGIQLADSACPSPSELAEQKQRQQAVRAIVHALPTKLRTAVVCVDLEGLSHAEAAQVLGCTGKAVENRLRRARERIRNQCAYWISEGKL